MAKKQTNDYTIEMLHDEISECKVLAEIMNMSLEQFAQIRDSLTIDYFYNTKHKAVYLAACACADERKEPSLPFVNSKLSGKADAPTMLELAEICEQKEVSSIQLPNYIDKLQDLAIRRKIASISCDLMRSGTTEAEDANTAIERTIEALKNLTIEGKDNSRTGSQVIDELARRINENIDGVQRGQLTGFSQIDKNGGLMKDDLIVIAGASSQGKTAFALNIAFNVLEKGAKVAIYSTEMRDLLLICRMLSSRCKIAGLNSNKIYRERLDEYEYEKVGDAMREMKEKFGDNVFFDDKASNRFSGIINSIRRKVLNEGIDGVVVDYLQNITFDSSKTENRNLEIAEAARRFKNLAMELNIWIVLLSQLNRDKINPEPSMSRLRDSGGIEEAADVIYMIYRPEALDVPAYKGEFENVDIHNTALIKQVKGRNIGIQQFMLGFNPDTTTFYELQELPIKVTSLPPFH